jgi:hypothetical protein
MESEQEETEKRKETENYTAYCKLLGKERIATAGWKNSLRIERNICLSVFVNCSKLIWNEDSYYSCLQ